MKQYLEPVIEIQNGQTLTSSKNVAEVFGKEHADVLKSIRNLECSKEFNEGNFSLVDYQDAKGESRPMYLMTQNGWAFLVMGFSGKKAAGFKEKYIAAFDQMKEQLTQPPALSGDLSDMLILAGNRLKEANMQIAQQQEANVLLAQENRVIKHVTDTKLTYNFTEAKFLLFRRGEIARDTFIRAMAELGMIHRFGNSSKSPWLPKSTYEGKGYFVVTNPKVGTDKTVEQTRITFDGLAWIYPKVCAHIGQPIDQVVADDINRLIVDRLEA